MNRPLLPTEYQSADKLDCRYVWCHMDMGYMQGMCDLVAPILVVVDDEALTYSCFCELMKRMAANFPQGGAMDNHLANMRSLLQILDSDIFELMHQNGDYTHFYFCYRWFLLDFKRGHFFKTQAQGVRNSKNIRTPSQKSEKKIPKI